MEFVGISELLLNARFSLASSRLIKLDRNTTVSITLEFLPRNRHSVVTIKILNPASSTVETHRGRARGNRYFVCGALLGIATKILESTTNDIRELPACQERRAMLPKHLPLSLFVAFARGFASATLNQPLKQMFASINCVGMKADNSLFTLTATERCVLISGNGLTEEVCVPSSLKLSLANVGARSVYVWSRTGLERIDRLLAQVSVKLAKACQPKIQLLVMGMQT